MAYPFFSFDWIVPGRLAASMRPRAAAEYRALAAAGIRGLLCLKETPHLFDEARAAGLHPVHVPIDDFDAPSEEALAECLEAIDAHPPTLVHCHAGLGRTGTVCAAWLALRLGIAAGEALSIVRALRPGSVESAAQAALILSLSGREAFTPPPGCEAEFERERARLLAATGGQARR